MKVLLAFALRRLVIEEPKEQKNEDERLQLKPVLLSVVDSIIAENSSRGGAELH